MNLLGTTIASMDCFNIIDGEEWCEAIDHGCLCAVAKAECSSEGEVEREEGEEVDGLDHNADALVATKHHSSCKHIVHLYTQDVHLAAYQLWAQSCKGGVGRG